MSEALSATTPATDLEVVNACLASIQQAPVSSLEGASLLEDVAEALRQVRLASLEVQSRPRHFNTEYNYTLTPDSNGYISVPSNVLHMDTDGSSQRYDVVVRGPRLYNRKDHTYVFSEALTFTIVFMLPFDELPPHARHYVAAVAVRRFQMVRMGDPNMDATLAEAEARALTTFSAVELNAGDHNFITGSQDALDVWVRGRDPYLIPTTF